MSGNFHQGYDEEGLKRLKDELSKQAGRADAYNALAETQEGRLLIADMRKRVDFIRGQYGHIDSTRPEASHLLAVMQESEREVGDWLSRLTNFRTFSKDVAHQIEAINKVISHRKNRVKRTDSQYAADEIIKKDEEKR